MFTEHNIGEVNTVNDTLRANNNPFERAFNLSSGYEGPRNLSGFTSLIAKNELRTIDRKCISKGKG